jgi:hypothetical protein
MQNYIFFKLNDFKIIIYKLNLLYEKIFFQEKYPNTCTSSSAVRNCRYCNFPGSRNAPLAIHFSEDSFNCYSIVDERSAAFVAMGMAKSEKKPVAVTCTSGLR